MIRDLVPRQQRRAWAEAGHYPDRDLYRLFAEQAQRRPDQPAVVDDSGTVTYAELLRAAGRVAAVLADHGIGRGDIVAVQLPNGWPACAVDIGVAAVGAVCLPYPVHYRESEVRMLLGRSRAVAAVVAREFGGYDFAKMLESLRPELPAFRQALVVGDPTGKAPSLDDALRGEGAEWPPADIDPEEPARVLVTSGTEAVPKMVLYSHNVIAGPMGAVVGGLGPHPDWRLLLMVPLSSGMGAIATFGSLACHGGTLVVTAAFSPARILALIAEHRVTHLVGVPAMFQMLLADPTLDDTDLSSVELVMTAGAAAAPSTIEEIQRQFRCAYVGMYGCSDGAFCRTRPDDPPDKIAATVGRDDAAISRLRVVDEQGDDVPSGSEGELWARGPFMPICYLGAPELDERYRTPDGWVKTGDIAVLDRDGYVRITGRLKDIIIRGGFNISPNEIESHLVTHPAILMAACVGMSDVRLGERVCSFLVLRPGAEPPTVESLAAFLLERGLARNKLPEAVRVVTELPVNPAGKVLKRVLRERLAAG